MKTNDTRSLPNETIASAHQSEGQQHIQETKPRLNDAKPVLESEWEMGAAIDRSEVTLQAKIYQTMADNSAEVTRRRIYQAMANQHTAQNNYVLQLVASSKKKTPRPEFPPHVTDMRKEAPTPPKNNTVHMAHRVSWETIRNLLDSNTMSTAQIKALCVPARDFGDPKKGGVKKGDPRFHQAITDLINIYSHNKSILKSKLAKALNASPYNLRPGLGKLNAAIKGNPDPHYKDNSDEMTPQTSQEFTSFNFKVAKAGKKGAVTPPKKKLSKTKKAKLPSSNYMNKIAFAKWEQSFEQYLLKAIKSVKKM